MKFEIESQGPAHVAPHLSPCSGLSLSEVLHMHLPIISNVLVFLILK